MTDRILALVAAALMFLAIFAGASSAPEWARWFCCGVATALAVIAATYFAQEA